ICVDFEEKLKATQSLKQWMELDKFHWNEKDLAAYEERVMNVYKDDNILAHKLDIATQKGRQEGREEGIKIGEEKGRKAEKAEVAKHLLKAGIPISIISESIGLTTSEIKKLR
ncbi:MAG: hypothetical protein KTV77_05540, partial [Wolbachia endosymbiont of Fragariocoptes setiger]|nr:hypothetical protein [Wolbachia endosymbiont of Fragariocoptes setiger]